MKSWSLKSDFHRVLQVNEELNHKKAKVTIGIKQECAAPKTIDYLLKGHIEIPKAM